MNSEQLLSLIRVNQIVIEQIGEDLTEAHKKILILQKQINSIKHE